jgi:hypothetical protein
MVPAIVLAALAGGGLKVHFFIGRLTDLADVKIVCQAIEAEAPRIAQPVGPSQAPLPAL